MLEVGNWKSELSMSTDSADSAWKSAKDLELLWPEWLVQELIPKESTVCLYGARGMGKSFVALDLALSIATGTEWNGLKVNHGCVGYMLAERPDGLKRRILGWAQHKGIPETELYQMLNQPGHGFFASGEVYKLDDHDPQKENNQLGQLTKHLNELDSLELVILDPLISYASGSENDARDMQKVVTGARRLVENCKCSLLLVHHAGKSSDQWDRGARGSSALEAAMDTVIALKGVGGQPQLEVTKQREHPQLAPMTLNFRSIINDEGYEMGQYPVRSPSNQDLTRGSLRESKRQRLNKALIETISILQGETNQDFIPFQDIAERAIADGIDLQKNSVRNYLNTLVKNGELSLRKGKHHAYGFIPQQDDPSEMPSPQSQGNS